MTILLDFHEQSFDPKHEPVRSELAVTAAASIAGAVCEMGQQVGLATNGRDAADRIAKQDGIVMRAPPQLSLFAFHLTWPGAKPDEENDATRDLLDRVAKRRRVLLTGCQTQIDGVTRYLARVCVLSFRTRQASIDACVEDIDAARREILAH